MRVMPFLMGTCAATASASAEHAPRMSVFSFIVSSQQSYLSKCFVEGQLFSQREPRQAETLLRCSTNARS